jgi:hypothetical protein
MASRRDGRGLPSLRPHRHYSRLHRCSVVRLITLREKVNGLTPTSSVFNDEQIAFVVIEAMNLWASFARAYYLSWFLGPITMTGHRVICSNHFRMFEDALVFAIRRLRWRNYGGVRPSRRDEPAWHESRTLLTLATDIGVSNLNEVQAAFSLGATYLSNLPVVRNFYAHRNDETFRKVREKAILLGLGRNLRPCEFVSTPLPSRPQNLICDWLDEIRLTVELLCV